MSRDDIADQLRRIGDELEALAGRKDRLYFAAILILAVVAIVAMVLDTEAAQSFVDQLFSVIPIE